MNTELCRLPRLSIHSNDLPDHYKGLELKLHTSPQSDEVKVHLDRWSGNQGRPIELTVQQRYLSTFVVEFQERIHIHHHISALATIWLKDIPDDEIQTLALPVWKSGLKRAEANYGLENGEKLGLIEVYLRFLLGISNHLKKLASKDKNLEDVMEVLGIAKVKKIQVSLEEAAFESRNNIPNHEDCHGVG